MYKDNYVMIEVRKVSRDGVNSLSCLYVHNEALLVVFQISHPGGYWN